jgi:hypothetical protein
MIAAPVVLFAALAGFVSADMRTKLRERKDWYLGLRKYC